MPRIQIPLQTAENSNEQANGERLLNLYMELLPHSAKSRVVLQATPGFSSFCTTPNITGLFNANGALYASDGSQLYSVDQNGTATPVSSSGSFGGNRTAITWNGTDFYTEPDHGACFIDGYFIRINSGGQFSWSNLYSTTFDPRDFATAEGSPDSLVGIAAVHRELWLFGRHTTEIWYNAGDPDQTFQRLNSAFVEYGAQGGIATLDNTIFWLGDDDVVYTANGYLPVRISTHEIEQKIKSATGEALAWTYKDEGHGFYVLRYEDCCLAFDTATGMWHERASFPGNTIPYTSHAYCYGKHLVGGPGGVYEMSRSIYDEAGGVIEREFITPPVYTDETRTWARCPSLELLMETGKGLTSGQGSDPQVMLQISDDGGRTWGNERWRSAGKLGEYTTRLRWLRNGRFRERSHKFRMTDPVSWSVIGLNADVQ